MINIKMQPSEVQSLSPKIIVIGVGGAGGNAVNNMISSGLEGCEFLVCNTDAQALDNSLAPTKLQLGVNVTGGLGAGSKPEIGQAAAEESLQEVMQHVHGANMAFITAGMGGGTGSGAAPVIAKACREQGILTVGVVTKPFHFEGSHRMKVADAGIEEMQGYVDTLIVIPNQNLFRVANEKTTFAEAFQLADSVLQAGVRGVTDLMVRPGLVNLDFADIRTAMLEMGKAMMGTGEASGDKRAIEAAEAAINNPLLDDVSMKGAHGLIINVTGGFDMTLFEADEACNRIRDEVDPDANIIFGATFDENLEGTMRVSIVATGIEKELAQKKRPVGSNGGMDATGKMLERAKPNTQTNPGSGQQGYAYAQGGQPQAQPQAQAQAPVQTPSFVPSQPRQPVAVAENVAPEPEQDLFEQGSFTAAEGASPAAPQNTALRGTVYKNAFIPPKPAEPRSDEGQSGYPAFHSGTALRHGVAIPKAPARAEDVKIPQSSMKLNPPQLPQPQPAENKPAPSFFERLAGSFQSPDDKKDKAVRRRVPPSPMSSGQQDAVQAAQPSLNIDSPLKTTASSDDLDIPAFLRRQAN